MEESVFNLMRDLMALVLHSHLSCKPIPNDLVKGSCNRRRVADIPEKQIECFNLLCFLLINTYIWGKSVT